MHRPAPRRWLPCLLQLLQLLQLLAHRSALGAPYSCKMDSSPLRPQHAFDTAMTVGVKGRPPALITLYYEGLEDGAVRYQLTLTDRVFMRIDREEGDQQQNLRAHVAPHNLLSDTAIRYFWVSAKDGTVAFGRAGEEEALLNATDPDFKRPKAVSFRSNTLWVHSCSLSASPSPPLGCSRARVSTRYDFSDTSDIRDEEVELGGENKAVRFMVRGTRDAYVRLRGIPGAVYYEIDLNFVNKIAIQRIAAYLGSTACNNCLSAHEFRLFTVVYNSTDLEVFEGAELAEPALSVKLMSFKVTSISFASMSSGGNVYWLHGCQGYNRQAPPEAAPPDSLPPPLPVPLSPQARAEALKSSLLVGCRMVHTFKYRFDSYFSLHEEGLVSGSTVVLPFRVLGRKDVHLQLVSSIPPVPEEVYEMDIDFYNRTNLDRGKEQKVSSSLLGNLLSPTELRGFVLEHDVVTGVINITTEDGRAVLAWRDPHPFALRYFSICSGSSAGNDTTWVFGCPGYPPSRPSEAARIKSGCSRPLHTFSYAHSQFLSVEREGVVTGNQRELFLYLRAKASGHIRLETMLPPAYDALFEVDLSHEGSTNIDSLGKRVASASVPGLLSEREQRGFWVRQDLDQRRIDVGRVGVADPIVSWAAPPAAKFPPVRFFSLATSKSVGNGTWYYGCKEGNKPEEEAEEENLFDLPEYDFPSRADWLLLDPDAEDLLLTDDDDGVAPHPGTSGADAPEPTAPRRTPSPSPAVLLRRALAPQVAAPPPDGTVIAARLEISKAALEDYMGALTLRGHLVMEWPNPNVTWNPKDFDNIHDVRVADTDGLWTPDIAVRNGMLELRPGGAAVYVDHAGKLRWRAPLRAVSRCRLHARHWPRDAHTCELNITLVTRGGRRAVHALRLVGEHEYHAAAGARVVSDWVAESAGAPFWEVLSLSAHVHDGAGAGQGPRGPTIRVVASLQRSMAVLHHLLLAPFVVISALCLLAYWVHEPLPRDKVVLGCSSLLFLVLSFLVLEAACPAGLMGMPLIVDVYCWCMCVLALSIVVSAILTAMSKDWPNRNPPAFLCTIVSLPLLRWVLMLHLEQANQRPSDCELRPDTVDYKRGSKQVYMRFDHEMSDDCKCGKRTCGKQVALEAKFYWTLLAMACERILSILCFVLLLVAAILMR